MSNEVIEVETQHPLTANAVVARVRLIQQVMTTVMKEGTHFGTIPGCAKPSLWKPGAEQLLVTFRIAPEEPKVEDLSTSDSIRYRVSRTGRTAEGGLVAAGVGECSSDEEKYKWRRPVSQAEYNATPEDRKRIKYKRDGEEQQVRTNPADVANTILKMADKRAFVAMTLLATAASDIFTQDLEDLPPEVAAAVAEGEGQKKEPIKPPQEKKAEAKGNTLTFIPEEVSEKSGEKNGKTWVKFGIKHGADWYGTFDENAAGFAKDAKENKVKVEITWEYDKSGKYKNLLTIKEAAQS